MHIKAEADRRISNDERQEGKNEGKKGKKAIEGVSQATFHIILCTHIARERESKREKM